MKYKSRVPVTPDPKIDKLLTLAAKRGEPAVIDGVNVYPPTNRTSVWRVRMNIQGKRHERTATGSNAYVYAAVLDLTRIRDAHTATLAGSPESCFDNVEDAIDEYINQGGPNQSWKAHTARDRRRDLKVLAEQCQQAGVRCHQLSPQHVRTFVTTAAGTASRGAHLLGIVRTFIKWGVSVGYFTLEQYEHCRVVQWTAPKGSNYKRAKTRRAQSEDAAASELGQGGQVMTTEQLNAFAAEVQKRYQHGEGLIHTAANLGTRAMETFILTASKDVAIKSGANYVDLDNLLVRVDVQVNDDPTIGRKTTKNGKRRVVTIPATAIIPSGFDLEVWLRQRCHDALLEQQQGTNPLALLFPSDKGGTLELHNFNNRVIRPAIDALGWKMPGYTDARGQVRHMRRFTFHGLRDYYASTAVSVWKYTPVQLLQQGSWADMQTVNKYYIGTSDDTVVSVQELHNARR